MNTLYDVKCIHRILYNVECTLYIVHCTVYIRAIQRTIIHN